MKQKDYIPPKAANRFLTWFLRNDLAEEVQGDLEEQFYNKLDNSTHFQSRLNYWYQVVQYIRPFAISKTTSHLMHYAMFRNYFKIGWRNLSARKGFATINVGGLALGFACSILIYLFVSHNLQYDNFHANSDRIYRFITEEHQNYIDYEASVPPGFGYSFRTEYDYAEKVSKLISRDNSLVAVDETRKLKKDIAYTQNEFFEIFSYPLLRGVSSLSEPNTALITEETAKSMFGKEDPIGKEFELDGDKRIIVTGVLKDLPATTLIQSDIFISLPTLDKNNSFSARDDEWRGISSNLQTFALLKPNQNIDHIESEIQGFVKKHRPDSKNVHHYRLQPLADIHLNPLYSGGINPNMLWLFSIIGFVILLVACINYVNITTAQSIKRSKEVGVRKVLGSYKSYLFWQFMTETFIITLLALVTGILLSSAALPYFNSIFGLKLIFSELLTLEFVGIITILLLGITLLSGGYPGVLLARIVPVLALKGKISERVAGGMLTRKVLVSTQFVISMVLIVGTIVINKQIKYATNTDLGYEKSGIIRVDLPDRLKPEQVEGLKSRIAQSSGVHIVSACYATPGAPNNSWGTHIHYDNRHETEEFSIQTKIGDKNYLETFDLELVAGRNFYEKDSVDEVVVNEMLATELGLDSPEELLGKPVSIAGNLVQATIVGVVADFHDQDFHETIRPIYVAPVTDKYYELSVKIDMNHAQNALAHIEKEWSTYFPKFIFEYDFLDDRVAEMYAAEQQFLSLTSIFSALAIFIGCLGIYGLILFFVRQKTKEIGIRKVLGSTVLDLLRLVMQDLVRLVAIAGVVATPIAWYLMNHWLQNYTYKTDLSWWIFATAIGLVLSITIITIAYQSVKAAKTNPVHSLRTE